MGGSEAQPTGHTASLVSVRDGLPPGCPGAAGAGLAKPKTRVTLRSLAILDMFLGRERVQREARSTMAALHSVYNGCEIRHYERGQH